MKFTQVSFLLATAAAPQASALKIFRNKKTDDAAADAQQQRQLADRWYAVRSPAGYDYGWCNSPVPDGYTETTYATDLACCQGAFPDQQSGYCLQWLQNPPTAAPTPTGGPDAWYKDNSVDASKGVCINTAPTPKDSSVTIYDTQAECCIKEYAFQADGYCLSQMVTPPTAAPTSLADKKWFKDPEANDFAKGTCINDGPVPSGYNAYDTNAECCAGEYATQTTGACYAGMANAPSAAPSAVADIKYYPDYDTDYEDATCLPGRMDGRPVFDSMAECCIGAYPAQTSGACFAGMDSPPTAAPTTLADKKWFKDPEANDFAKGTCINDGPVPSGYKAYDTNAECCAGEYATQITGACFAGMANAPSAAPSSVDDIKYYPDYDTDYEDATCLPGTMDGRPSFSSMAACCIGSYPDQTSGACFAGMANAPSAAPSSVDDIKYYPDYDTDYEEATCLPGTMDGRPSFSSMAACCIGSYPDQISGACFAGMANAPSAAPSALSDVKWYPDYDTPYDEATCLSGGNPNGRPTYATQGECCIKAYPDQTTGACFAGMATAPSAAPSSVDDIKWFPDWSKAWTDGVCISGAAPPSGYTFASQAECCLNAYAGQSSGACLADMDSPPTAAPFTVADLVFYPIYTGDWSTGYCDNDPAKAPTVGTLGVSIFTTQAACCDLYFPNQPGRFCKTRVPFEGTLAPTPAPIYFYPKWGSSVDEGRCLNDGMEPAGINLYLDGKECCESEFPKSDGTPGIGGCLLALGYTNAPTATPTPKPTHKPVPDLP